MKSELELQLLLTTSAVIRHFIQSNNNEIPSEVSEMIVEFHRMITKVKTSTEKSVVIRSWGNLRYKKRNQTTVNCTSEEFL